MPLGPGTSELTPSMVDPPLMPARIETVRRQFDRRAARILSHDALLREIAIRIGERLDVIRITPQAILDVGCGRGVERRALRARYPRATWLGIDLSTAMLAGARATALPSWRRVLGARSLLPLICADAGALPLADDSIDLVYSNLMLHWHPTPHRVVPEWHRVLRTDGLVMFSCFGPDTLKELRQACSDAGLNAHPMPFVDMHDFGDMLVASQFATPVVDSEILTLTYPDPAALLAEVRALGGNPRDDRAASLPGGRTARALVAALGRNRAADGRIALTFEVVYGHAWKRPPRQPRGGVATVSLDALRDSLHRG
jgi:malonyl-CoA O-methyltransferase